MNALQAEVPRAVPPPSEEAVAATKTLCTYIWETYGRFPATIDPFVTTVWYQSCHLDVDFYDKDEIDVGVLIETETTLALPMKPLCREGCLGLCPVCGGNRNLVQCDCQQRAPDPRLAALKDLAARFSR